MNQSYKAKILLFIFSISLLAYSAPAHAMEQQPATTQSTSSWLQRHWKMVTGMCTIAAAATIYGARSYFQARKHEQQERDMQLKIKIIQAREQTKLEADKAQHEFRIQALDAQCIAIAQDPTLLQYITSDWMAGTLLITASAQGSLSVVQLLLEKYPNLLYAPYYYAEALQAAEQHITNHDSRYAHLALPCRQVRDYLIGHIKQSRNNEKYKALCKDAIRMVIDANLPHLVDELRAQGLNHLTAFEKAKYLTDTIKNASNKKVNMTGQVDCWLRAGADPRIISDSSASNAFVLAIRLKQYDIARLFLARNPELAQQKSIYDMSEEEQSSTGWLQFGEESYTPLEMLAGYNDLESVEWLLSLPVELQPIPNTYNLARDSINLDTRNLVFVWETLRSLNDSKTQEYDRNIKKLTNIVAHPHCKTLYPRLHSVVQATLPPTLIRSQLLAALGDKDAKESLEKFNEDIANIGELPLKDTNKPESPIDLIEQFVADPFHSSYPHRIAQDRAQRKAHAKRRQVQTADAVATDVQRITRFASRYGYTSELVQTYLRNKVHRDLVISVDMKVQQALLTQINHELASQSKPRASRATPALLQWHDLSCVVKPGEDISGTTMNEDFNDPMSIALDYLNPLKDSDLAKEERDELRMAEILKPNNSLTRFLTTAESQRAHALAIDTARVKALSKRHGRHSTEVTNYLEQHVRDDLRVAVTTALDGPTNTAIPTKTALPLDARDDNA